MLRKIILSLTASAVLVSGALPSTALAADKSSGRKAQEAAAMEIPTCTKKLGTIAIVEPDTNWWQPLGLASPEAVLKYFVMKSGCFNLVDRGKGLAGRNIEKALAENGDLQQGSNVGGGQVKSADYLLVPDLVSKNTDSGGSGIAGGIAGALGGRLLGGLVGGFKVSKKEASVMLTLVNTRTTEQERMTEGYARKKDLGWSMGGGGLWGGGLAGAGGGSYEKTDIGQVIILAYLSAYRDMVFQLGGLPDSAADAAPAATS